MTTVIRLSRLRNVPIYNHGGGGEGGGVIQGARYQRPRQGIILIPIPMIDIKNPLGTHGTLVGRPWASMPVILGQAAAGGGHALQGAMILIWAG